MSRHTIGRCTKWMFVETVTDARGVVQVLHSRVAIFVVCNINQIHRSAGSAIMHAGAGKFEIVHTVAAVQGDRTIGARDRVLDQGAGESDTPVIAQNRASVGEVFDARGRGVGQANGFERLQGPLVDAQNIFLRQGVIGAAGHASAHGAQVVGQRGCTGGAACGTATGAGWGNIVHVWNQSEK